jgi:hypothetical protein
MALLYADENFDYPVVERLRALNHDVLTVQEAGRRGLSDAHVLADATAAGRAVLTLNHKHFARLHRQSAAHSGIISCTNDAADALAARIHQVIAAIPDLAGCFVRVTRPHTP